MLRNNSPAPEIAELETARIAAQVGVVDLCRVAGVSLEAFRLLRLGQRQPRLATLHRLREALERIQSGNRQAEEQRRRVGSARSVDELRRLLAKRRKDMRLTQLDVDDLAGFQTGYTGKIELGAGSSSGRIFGIMSLETLMRVLRVHLEVRVD